MRIHYASRVPIILSLLLFSGCGGPATNPPTGQSSSSNQNACTITLSGQVSATIPCTATLVFNAGTNQSVFTVTQSPGDSGSGFNAVTLSIFWNGDVSSGSVLLSAAQNFGALVSSSTGAGSWTAAKTPQLIGSVDVSITKFLSGSVSGPLTIYLPHGTASAALVAVQGSGAPEGSMMNLQIKF